MLKQILFYSSILFVLACASPGDLDADKKLTVSLDSFGPVYVQVQSKDKDWNAAAKELELRTIEGLKKMYKTPVSRKPAKADSGALIHIEITEFYKGSWFLRTFPFFGFLYPPNPKGDTMFYSKGRIVDLNTGNVLTKFELDSSSRDWYPYAGGGISGRAVAAAADNNLAKRTDRAIRAAVEEIRVYLSKP